MRSRCTSHKAPLRQISVIRSLGPYVGALMVCAVALGAQPCFRMALTSSAHSYCACLLLRVMLLLLVTFTPDSVNGISSQLAHSKQFTSLFDSNCCISGSLALAGPLETRHYLQFAVAVSGGCSARLRDRISSAAILVEFTGTESLITSL